jgi:cation transport protein ChaC
MEFDFDAYRAPDLELPAGDLWVFGYGSVMWRPDFPHLESRPARLHGYHRALCVWSWVHRGSRERPGLVLGLDAGGSCIGRAFRVAAADKETVAHYLYRRELVTPAYIAMLHPVRLAGGEVTALAFKVDRRHAQYVGKLPPSRMADVVRGSTGHSGANPDYVISTVAHLEEMGLPRSPLHEVRDLLVNGISRLD